MNFILKVSALVLLVAVAASMSGCCCCYGMDGFTSKFQKSANLIQFPSTVNIGGKTLTKISSEFYATAAACRDASMAALQKEGLGGRFSGGDIDQALSIAGGNEGKSFEYADASGDKRIGGFVGKSDSPGKLSASFIAGKPVLDGTQDIKYVESFKAGDEAYVYHTDSFREPAYIAICRYSNMLIYACSYDSSEDAQAAVRMAIEAIDQAAA
jgi:hypothetical protein